ncbi:hypothetical protein SPRG_13339 [Saprolegnia parasitica CBS 223.65]|uniref:Uncharacterized protein n=1 Tax=Saprolegnia parasitica (strain CBS 223.65) TaxID=695850 RepID=A0A067C1U3_SAPPC|nr:hypothetical protein SPRG_13339 [Saprolegnia parasitica CBS 223.65]KDO20757.1 hypothetical protein SPRG_13339 [Saprolegnia parasitica CBS 223.65]|eukprot:XP_012208569.1 hypothetical protein SPRG_13339 [Saprolegnia parasitica CBS 223.65]
MCSVTTSLAVASSGAVDYGSVQAEGKDNDCVVMASAGDGEDDEDPADYQDMNMVDLIFDGKTAVAKHRLENGLYTKEDLVATRVYTGMEFTVAHGSRY